MASTLNYVSLLENFTGLKDLKFQADLSGYTGETYLSTTIDQSFNEVTISNKSVTDSLRFAIETADAALDLSSTGDGILEVLPGGFAVLSDVNIKRLRIYMDGTADDVEIILKGL